MKLTKLEQETIILFNEAEATASIQVHNSRLRRRLEQLHADRPGEVSRDYNGDYIIPKGWLRINPGVLLTEEQRDKRSKRMRQMRKAQIRNQSAKHNVQ